MLKTFQQLPNKIKIAICVFGLFFIISLGFYIYSLQFSATLYIYSIPDKLQMSYDTIHNKNVMSKQDIKVRPGNHSYTFSAEGFESYTVSMDLKSNEKKNIVFALKPLSDAAKKESLNEKYTDVKEGIFNKESMKKTQNLEETNPIIKLLPLYGKNFSIFPCGRYRSNGDKTIGLCIKVTDFFDKTHIDEAFAKLKEKGISPEDYDIRINNQIWPTEKEINGGLVKKCSGFNPDWCYIYTSD